MRRLLLCIIAPLFIAMPIGTYAAEAPTRDPEALKALTNMSQFIQKQKNFTLSVDSTMDLVLDNGQLIQFAHHTDVSVARPNNLRIKTESSSGQIKEVFYDGKTFTIFDPKTNFYAIVPAPSSLNQLLATLNDKYNIQLPMTDLFHWGTDQAPLSQIEQALFIGEETINGKVTNHYSFRQGSLDWQLWTEKGKSPAPVKIVIVNLADEARPQYIASINFKSVQSFDADTFHFSPPKGAREIRLTEIQAPTGAAQK